MIVKPCSRISGCTALRLSGSAHLRFSADPWSRIGGAAMSMTRPPLAGLRPARQITFAMLSNDSPILIGLYDIHISAPPKL
jgi:hypothetical protein